MDDVTARLGDVDARLRLRSPESTRKTYEMSKNQENYVKTVGLSYSRGLKILAWNKNGGGGDKG